MIARILLLLALSLCATPVCAQTGPEARPEAGGPAAARDPGPAPEGPFGIAVKRPVLGAACPGCPWGALADKVRAAMVPLGYDVQVCHACSGVDSVRIVDERRTPPPPTARQIGAGARTPPPAPVDFGVVAGEFLCEAYHGTGRYASDPPRPDLRLIARIEDPNYYLVAVRRGGAIADLADIAARHLPATIVIDDKALAGVILDYYGIREADLVAWGGRIVRGPSPDRADYSVIIAFADGLNNTPESGIWYQLSQTSDMRFLQLPEPLLAKLSGPLWSIRETPVNLIRGMDAPIRTVTSSGTLVYGRADLPDRFAYDVARALDRGKGLLKWSIIPFSYEPEQVGRYADLPLHPGAARYYRERRYPTVRAASERHRHRNATGDVREDAAVSGGARRRRGRIARRRRPGRFAAAVGSAPRRRPAAARQIDRGVDRQPDRHDRQRSLVIRAAEHEAEDAHRGPLSSWERRSRQIGRSGRKGRSRIGLK